MDNRTGNAPIRKKLDDLDEPLKELSREEADGVKGGATQETTVSTTTTSDPRCHIHPNMLGP